jgi:hypothetical protein
MGTDFSKLALRFRRARKEPGFSRFEDTAAEQLAQLYEMSGFGGLYAAVVVERTDGAQGRVRKAGCHRGEVRFRCILVVAAPSREVPFIIGLPTLAIFCRQPGSKSPVRLSSQRGGV